MDIDLQEAHLHSLGYTLHCKEPGKDAVYDIQLGPRRKQRVSGTRGTAQWSVNAQHARNGSPPKWACKLAAGTYREAMEVFRATVTERLSHGYIALEPARHSNMLESQGKAIASLLEGAPTWSGFQEHVIEVHKDVSRKLEDVTDWNFLSLVLVADLAWTCAEGLPDAVAKFSSAPEIVQIEHAVHPATLRWALKFADKLPGSKKQDTILEEALRLVCRLSYC